MWWCPAGTLVELPLHAAGIYKGTSQDCLANYVVSSYTPTLGALVNAQAKTTRRRLLPEDGPPTLVVSLPWVSSLSPLPNAQIEAEIVQNTVPGTNITKLSDKDANIASVLAGLPDASILHLACHGHQSQDDPLTSGFSLHDGRLTLEQLGKLHLPNAELAYLSACETASTDKYQPDEVMNMAATILFIGFKSVIATMWYVF